MSRYNALSGTLGYIFNIVGVEWNPVSTVCVLGKDDKVQKGTLVRKKCSMFLLGKQYSHQSAEISEKHYKTNRKLPQILAWSDRKLWKPSADIPMASPWATFKLDWKWPFLILNPPHDLGHCSILTSWHIFQAPEDLHFGSTLLKQHVSTNTRCYT